MRPDDPRLKLIGKLKIQCRGESESDYHEAHYEINPEGCNSCGEIFLSCPTCGWSVRFGE